MYFNISVIAEDINVYKDQGALQRPRRSRMLVAPRGDSRGRSAEVASVFCKKHKGIKFDRRKPETIRFNCYIPGGRRGSPRISISIDRCLSLRASICFLMSSFVAMIAWKLWIYWNLTGTTSVCRYISKSLTAYSYTRRISGSIITKAQACTGTKVARIQGTDHTPRPQIQSTIIASSALKQTNS